MRKTPLKHGDTVAARLRNLTQLRLLSPFNEKTPKGEALGYLTAILYLAPHTVAGGKSVCPHSTPACRAGCLFTAGRGQTPRVSQARIRRTKHFLDHRDQFLADLVEELARMQNAADAAGLKLAIRLNGTSDILWEREVLDGTTIFDRFPRATFYDYTRTPARHRRVPANWRLTFSLADEPAEVALEHFRAGRSVAAVVPDDDRPEIGSWFSIRGGAEITVVDGDEHDLRFLDPQPALVILRPKGALRRGGPMVHRDLFNQLRIASRRAA